MEIEWCEIKAEEYYKLIESMSRKIKGAINAKGGHTKYQICDVSV